MAQPASSAGRRRRVSRSTTSCRPSAPPRGGRRWPRPACLPRAAARASPSTCSTVSLMDLLASPAGRRRRARRSAACGRPSAPQCGPRRWPRPARRPARGHHMLGRVLERPAGVPPQRPAGPQLRRLVVAEGHGQRAAHTCRLSAPPNGGGRGPRPARRPVPARRCPGWTCWRPKLAERSCPAVHTVRSASSASVWYPPRATACVSPSACSKVFLTALLTSPAGRRSRALRSPRPVGLPRRRVVAVAGHGLRDVPRLLKGVPSLPVGLQRRRVVPA